MSDQLPPSTPDPPEAAAPAPDDMLPPAPAGSPEPSTTPPRRKAPVAIIAGVLALIVVIVAAIVLTRPKSDPTAASTTPSASLPTTSSSLPAGGQTYAANGVTLQYPEGWISGPSIFAKQTKTSVWSETFAPALGNPNGVLVTQYQLSQDLSTVAASAMEAQLKSTVEQSLGGQNVSDVTATTVGTFPAYEVTFSADLKSVTYTIDMTFIFSGLTQYNIACQSSEDQASVIAVGCDQVKSTFQVTAASASP